ncbi:MAG: TetR/AcrR family transcriptional regulator [Alphaproteobacteria bacterium]
MQASRREDSKAALKAKIVEAAARLFGAKPYDAVQMDDVARAAGIGKPTLYRYFPSKDELFLLVTERALERLTSGLSALRDGHSPSPDKLRSMVDALVDALGTSFVSLRALSGENPPLAARWRNLFRGHREAIMSAFSEVLAAGAASGDFRMSDTTLMPAMIVGMVRGALMAVPKASHARLAEVAADLVIEGVARRAARRRG